MTRCGSENTKSVQIAINGVEMTVFTQLGCMDRTKWRPGHFVDGQLGRGRAPVREPIEISRQTAT
jgi:hypothetical protein